MTDRHGEDRRDYSRAALSEAELAGEPLAQFTLWLEEAKTLSLVDATAMTVATADAAGVPSARIVLLKHHDEEGFVFYTDYASAKGKALAENNRAELLFYWRELERQVRIAGRVEQVSRESSEAYWQSRPRGSQLSATASKQSAPVESRAMLMAEVERLQAQDTLPLPDNWGGYRLVAEKYEFWQGRDDRLHDRFEYSQSGSGWHIQRLQP